MCHSLKFRVGLSMDKCEIWREIRRPFTCGLDINLSETLAVFTVRLRQKGGCVTVRTDGHRSDGE